MVDLRQGKKFVNICIPEELKLRLDSLKLHHKESYWEVIERSLHVK